MDSVGAYGGKAVGAFMIIPTLYMVWDFNAQLQFSSLWGIERAQVRSARWCARRRPPSHTASPAQLLLYMLFCAAVFPFMWVQRAFGFNAQELFLGWRVHEYLKYARYRFSNRTARWKALELHVDESIEPAMRSTDQLCFSSQWYFVLALNSVGGVMTMLGCHMLLMINGGGGGVYVNASGQSNYDPFGDILLPTIIFFEVAVAAAGRRLIVRLAGYARLWRLRTRSFDGGLDSIDTELGDAMSAAQRDAFFQGANVGAAGGFGGVHGPPPPGPPRALTSADLQSEAFRQRFLAENKLWLLDHLSKTGFVPAGTYTGPAPPGYYGRGLSSDDEPDGSDSERRHGAEWRSSPLYLAPASVQILRHWAAAAILRAPGRLGHPARQLLTSDSSEDEGTSSHSSQFPPFVPPSPVSCAVLLGWLAAARSSAAAARLTRVSTLSSDDSDQAAPAPARGPAPRPLGEDARFVALGWLSLARARRSAALQQ